MQTDGATSEEEKRLMERIARGDASAFRRFVEAHQRSILDLGRRLLRDPAEADDLCQEVCLQVLRKASSFRGEGSLRGWVIRIATNRALNLLRKARPPSVESPNGKPGPTPAPPSILEREEKARAVREAVASLPERQRAAVILLRYERLTYREIARVLDCGLPATVSLIHRAHETLREKLRNLRK
jgi:RNA polymerase sigma-70 factor (ECF subfamily)